MNPPQPTRVGEQASGSRQPRSPGAPLTNFNDGGGPIEVHILYPKKSQLQNLSSTQKNHYFF